MTPGLLTALKGRMGESTQNVKVKSTENESDSLSASNGNVDLKKGFFSYCFAFDQKMKYPLLSHHLKIHHMRCIEIHWQHCERERQQFLEFLNRRKKVFSLSEEIFLFN